jgi:hypothetical protein
MAMPEFPFTSLLAHPSVSSGGVQRVAARAEILDPESLRFQYVLEADPLLVRIPSPIAEAGRTDGLWAHTCFEAFVGLPESPRYLELNFSPSGQWAAYRFESYRQGMAPALDTAPLLAVRRSAERLELRAEVQLGGSLSSRASRPGAAGNPRVRIALATVVEDREGRLSYWALRHPPGRPDFHHPESFSLALELPDNPLNPS